MRFINAELSLSVHLPQHSCKALVDTKLHKREVYEMAVMVLH